MRLKTYKHKDYSGGLNDSTTDGDIERDQASVLQNWDITFQGQLRKRLGLTQVGDQLDNPAESLGAFIRDDGKDLLAYSEGILYYLDSATWTALQNDFNAGLPLWFENIQVEGKIYMCNEDNNLFSWDRGVTTLNGALEEYAGAPHGNVMRWHKNHLFHLNNVNVGGDKFKHRIYWSNLGDPETYDTANNFFEVPGDGACVTMIDQGDYMVIFKERAIQYLSGWGSSSWQVTATSSNVANISEKVGIAGIHALTKVGDEIWFMDDEGQIRRLYQTEFDTFRRDIVSSNIQGTLSSMNKAQISKTRMWTANDKVYVAIPTESSSFNDLVLVYDLLASKRTKEEAWTTYTGWNVGVFLSYLPSTTPVLYIADADEGKVYSHTGNDDDGVAIDCRYDSKNDTFEEDERFKRYKFMYITGVASTDEVTVGIYASVNDSPFGHLGDLELMGSGSKLGPTGSFLLGPTGDATLGGAEDSEKKLYYTDGGGTPRGKRLKHSIRYTGSGDPVVNQFTSHWKLRTLR